MRPAWILLIEIRQKNHGIADYKILGIQVSAVQIKTWELYKPCSIPLVVPNRVDFTRHQIATREKYLHTLL